MYTHVCSLHANINVGLVGCHDWLSVLTARGDAIPSIGHEPVFGNDFLVKLVLLVLDFLGRQLYVGVHQLTHGSVTLQVDLTVHW